MAGRTLTYYEITCDGCGQQLGKPGDHFDNAMEAHAAAYSLGWRFPSKLLTNGKPSNYTSDVCPKCAPTFQRETFKSKPMGRPSRWELNEPAAND